MNIIKQGTIKTIIGPFKCPECNCVFEIKFGEERDRFRNATTLESYFALECPCCNRYFTSKYKSAY